ncbi:hypothetical protein CORC01_11688 [Colletotrichum orchidophilum]|uniref:Uncharacterized protein n=1 Tax=Colletotrichum orchidophilum TaxID=1209926 RepID=A0A1G4AV54_9PEZI|nr:uncharacterized protein CORC01_11688 [Colletotrichum orchidophilum]OHE93049.1 hypothetical protein CORC01_11688 [Colletotrichum orchidophilum]
MLPLSRFLQPSLLVLYGCRRCCWPWSEPGRLDVSPVRRGFETLSFSLFALCNVSSGGAQRCARWQAKIRERADRDSGAGDWRILCLSVGRSVEGVEAEVRRLGERKVEEVGCTRAELYFTGLRGTHEKTGVLETTPREKRSRASSRPCRVDRFQAARLMGTRRQGLWRECHGADCCAVCFVCMEGPRIKLIKCQEISDAGSADASDCCSRRRLLRFPANDCRSRYNLAHGDRLVSGGDGCPRLSCLAEVWTGMRVLT